MKKILMVTGIILVFVVYSFAGFNFDLWGGFTTVGMKEINDEYIDQTQDSFYNWFISHGMTPDITSNRIGAGYNVGINISYSPVNFISFGIKTGYINAGGSIKLSASNIIREQNITTTLVPLMSGISGQFAFSDIPVSLGAGIYAGYGFAGCRIERKITTGSITNTEWLSADGGTFIADIFTKAGYKFLSWLCAGLTLGYRVATVNEMKVSQKSSDGFLGVPVGEVLPDIDGNPAEFDYSGFVVNAFIEFSI